MGVDADLNQEVKRAEAVVPTPEVRGAIAVFGDAKVDDLLTASGKSKLKQDILGALKERIPQLGAERVYFSESDSALSGEGRERMAVAATVAVPAQNSDRTTDSESDEARWQPVLGLPCRVTVDHVAGLEIRVFLGLHPG